MLRHFVFSVRDRKVPQDSIEEYEYLVRELRKLTLAEIDCGVEN